MVALILSGGAGTRFWPMSTKERPKQYLKLFDNKSTLALTVKRLLLFIGFEHIYIVTTRDQISLIKEEIPNIQLDQIIVEPFGMNTATCIGMAALYLSKRYGEDEIILVTPADHYILDVENYASSVLRCANSVQDNLATFGITPTYPATGYGYVESGAPYNDEMFHVKRFKEKPCMDVAVEMIKSGGFLWNSGMFCWQIKTILDSMKQFVPAIIETGNAVLAADNLAEKEDIYRTMPRVPIDIAVMEKASNVLVMPVSFRWSDVGTWHSLSELMPKDEDNNYLKSGGKSLDSYGVSAFSNKRVALVGVSDIVIVETDDTLLVVKKDMTERVKDVIIQ